MIKKLYPNGKSKAFNVSYDDGVLQDVRFVNLLNQYGLKGTFNLNSGLMENEFEWIHESGCIVKRLSKEKVLSLYDGQHILKSHLIYKVFGMYSKNFLISESFWIVIQLLPEADYDGIIRKNALDWLME